VADKGYITTQINTLPEDIRYALRNAFWYVMDTWRIGTGPKAINAQWYRVTGTTASVANTEFSVSHGMASIPTQVFQVLDLSQVNSQIVPLTVTRTADVQRLYLSSPSTSAVFTLLVE
jgi:hypothetical protein